MKKRFSVKIFSQIFSSIFSLILIINIWFFSFSQKTFAVSTNWTASSWTYEKARHLAKKVLFSPKKEQVDQFFLTWSALNAVNILFPSRKWPDRTKFNELMFWSGSWSKLFNPTVLDNLLGNDLSNIKKYYIYKKYLDPYDAKAKLFLMFEDIFSVNTIRDRIFYSDIEKTHNMIFDDIFWVWWYKKIVKDVLFWWTWSYALWEYLDLFNMNKEYPNENYPRELLQLFMMWIFKPYDNKADPNAKINYTDSDIAAISKIMTWLTDDSNHIVSYYSWDVDKYWHNLTWNWDLDWDWIEWDVIFLDWDLKNWDSFPFYNSWSWTINLSKITESIDWNNWLADNLIDYIFSKRHHEIALFLADKIFRFYANLNPTKEELESFATQIENLNFDVYDSVKYFLASDAMYSEKSMNEIYFKNPVELGIWTFKLLNKNPKFWDLEHNKYSIIYDLWWDPYNAHSIFWRDWYEDNSAFYNSYTHDKWMTYSTSILNYNENPEFTNYLNEIIPNTKIAQTWEILFSSWSWWNIFWWNYSWNILFDQISLNLTWTTLWEVNNTCSWNLVFWSWSINFPNFDISTNSWWLIKIWSWSLKIPDVDNANNLEIFSWSVAYSWSICKILSWIWNISDWPILSKTFSVEDFFSVVEKNFYLWIKIPDFVKNYLKIFLTTGLNWEKIFFDTENSNYRNKKIIPALANLFSQPEFVLISWSDKEEVLENYWDSPFTWKDAKLIILKLAWGYDWLNWIIPKKEYNSTYQDFRKKTENWLEIANIIIPENKLDFLDWSQNVDWSWYFINKSLTTFKWLYDSWDLKIINRVWVSNHSRWHDVASNQTTSSDWKAVYSESEWLIWRLSKNETNDLRNLSIRSKPYVYRWWKYINIWWAWLKVYVYWWYSTEEDLDIINSFSWIIASRIYPWKIKNIFKWALDLDKIWTIAKNSDLNRDWAWYNLSDNLSFVKIAMENWVWSTYYLTTWGYDTHRDQLKVSEKYPDWTLNNRLWNVAWDLVEFYNSVKNTQDITIVVQSEFWRTLRVNWSNWTDHWKWWWLFILSNNSKFKQEVPSKIYWKMNLAKEKENFLWVWIDFRAVYTKILNSLYNVSDSYFWDIYKFEDFLDKNPPKIEYFRPEFKRYSWSTYVNLKFSVKDKNFKLYDWSKVEVYYWSNLDNLSKYKSYYTDKFVRTSQWNTETTYVDWDKFTLDFPIWKFTANSKYFYKVVAMDNQFDETIFTWSFVVPKVIDNININKFDIWNSSILRKYNNTTITWSTLIWTWIILAEAWTWEILFWTWSDNIQMKAFSWITKISNLTSIWTWTGKIWNWWFILPKEVDKSVFLPSYAKSNWENLSDLEIPKIIKVWADVLWIWMNLNQEVEITIPWIPVWKNYWIISSTDWKTWNPVNSEVSLSWSWDLTFKTNHFSYFAPVVWDPVSCSLTLNSNENTVWWNVSFQFSSENAISVKLENWNWENIFISWKTWTKTITLSDTATWKIVYSFTVSNAISEKICNQTLEILPVEANLNNWEILSSTWIIFTWSLAWNSWEKKQINLRDIFKNFWENQNNSWSIKSFSATWNFLKFLNKKILDNSWKNLVEIKIWTWTKIYSPRVFDWNFKKQRITWILNKNIIIWWIKKIRKFKNPIKIWWLKTLILDNYATLKFKLVWINTSKFWFRKWTSDENEEWTFKDIENSICKPVFPNECAYHDWEDVILKTFHFTEFVVIEDDIIVDSCPSWDYSWSNTDWSCWSAPVISSWWWWGWGWSFWPTVWNYTISAISKKDIETFDNLDFKRIKNWVIPVNIKMKDLSWKYSVEILKNTKITINWWKNNWKFFSWKLMAPKRLSNTKVPKINWAFVALRALEIWLENENLKFSKDVKIIFSTAWLSKKIRRRNILAYSWNNDLKKYLLETTNVKVDEKNEKISFETNHATKFILTNWPIYLESWNSFQKINNLTKNSTKNLSDNIYNLKTNFSDIKNHWAKNYIEELTEKWIFKNSDDFRPNDNLTRAELAKILVKWFNLQKNISTQEKIFSDVKKNSWYENYIKILFSNNIFNWYLDWTAKPWNSVNRAEAMKLIVSILEQKWVVKNIIIKRSYFSDIKKWSWFYNYVNKWRELWIINWYSDWTFWAEKNITRAEIAKIISLSLGKILN